jgi:hypothetical protein
MIHKCAMDDCTREFKYFRDGKLYEFPYGHVSAGKGARNLERRMFWLCERCSARYRLDYRNGEVIAVARQQAA